MRTTVDAWKQYYESVANGEYAFEHVLNLDEITHLPKWMQGYLCKKAAIPPLPSEMAFVYGPETQAHYELILDIRRMYLENPTRFRIGGDSYWYRESYLKTSHWISKRAEALSYRMHRCMRCGAEGATDVHHLHYHLFFESVYHDLEVLCRRCHQLAHPSET